MSIQGDKFNATLYMCVSMSVRHEYNSREPLLAIFDSCFKAAETLEGVTALSRLSVGVLYSTLVYSTLVYSTLLYSSLL